MPNYNTNEPLVSIVVPVYNVERYIERCISSVFSQTYRPLEVILIDDCSPDRSIEVAKEYIAVSVKENLDEHRKFVFLKHESNRVLSAARNTGINAATGAYVYFLDSDDAIEVNTISELMSSAKRYNYPEMIVGGIRIEGDRKDLSNRIYQDSYFEGNDTIREMYLTGIPYMMAWNKMVRLDFLKKNKLFFVEGIIHEDNPWSFYVSNRLNSIAFCSCITYIYYLRSDSIMAVLSDSKRMKRYESLMKILEVYDKGFRTNKLVCSKGNARYFTRLKYDYITEIANDSNISIKYKAKCLYSVLGEKWVIQFLFKWIELSVKTHLWRMFHKQ